MPTRLAGRITRLLLILALLGSQWAWARHDHAQAETDDRAVCQWCAYLGAGKALADTAPAAALPDGAGLPQPAPTATRVAQGPEDWRLGARGPPQNSGQD